MHKSNKVEHKSAIMKKFGGILICSDIDGTFNGDENVIAENIKAVEYFKSHGGRFTFCTGRNVAYLKEMGLSTLVNAPACLLNGSVIYDYENKKELCKKNLPFTVSEFAQHISSHGFPDFPASVFTGYEKEELFNVDLSDIPPEIAHKKPLKIVCRFDSVEKTDAFKSYAKEISFFKECYISKSWSVGVEFNSISATKGNAVEFIKNYLDDIHTSVGIGDYENDIPLLEKADIGVCVENGLDEVKQAADMIVKSNIECAIADLIKKL